LTRSFSSQQIYNQVAVLNQRYAGTGFQFRLVGIDRWRQAYWFYYAGPNTVYQTQMKNYLRKGGKATLNVYSVGFVNIAQQVSLIGKSAITRGTACSRDSLSQGLLGYATFPWQVGNLRDDGIVLLYTAIPGGTKAGYTGGITLVHEAGHWLGVGFFSLQARGEPMRTRANVFDSFTTPSKTAAAAAAISSVTRPRRQSLLTAAPSAATRAQGFLVLMTSVSVDHFLDSIVDGAQSSSMHSGNYMDYTYD
jgi:hypothetical protein